MFASSLLILFSSSSLARAFLRSAMNWTNPRMFELFPELPRLRKLLPVDAFDILKWVWLFRMLPISLCVFDYTATPLARSGCFQGAVGAVFLDFSCRLWRLLQEKGEGGSERRRKVNGGMMLVAKALQNQHLSRFHICELQGVIAGSLKCRVFEGFGRGGGWRLDVCACGGVVGWKWGVLI